jgi:hypothetical protein
MENTISDAKYWLKKYGDDHKESAGNFEKMKYHVDETLNLFKDELARRVKVKDMQCNFETLNDLLFVKFK